MADSLSRLEHNINMDSLSHLEHILSIPGVLEKHIAPLLSCLELATLEIVSSTCKHALNENEALCWKAPFLRDYWEDAEPRFISSRAAPVYNERSLSFDTLQEKETWKLAYEKWTFWRVWTGGAQAKHGAQAIEIWERLKRVLKELNLSRILESLLPCPDRAQFRVMSNLPSSMRALYSVHGGQSRDYSGEIHCDGLLGSFSWYNNLYSMRLISADEFQESPNTRRMGLFMVGSSMYGYTCTLNVKPTEICPEGTLYMQKGAGIIVVGEGGMLQYLEQYTERLENGVYTRCESILQGIPNSCGISLFPDAGDSVSCCVTNGIEVRASARWLPGAGFVYFIRIRILPDDPHAIQCQLKDRHWEFVDGTGSVTRVDGEAVVGKQPLFYIDSGRGGYCDLGPAGDREMYPETTFTYVSQTGPVAGISRHDTGSACVRGTFTFVPGRIEDPAGPQFEVKVGSFPLSIPFPFF